MNKLRFFIACLLLFTLVLPSLSQDVSAQDGGVVVRYKGVGGQLSPGKALLLEFTVVNQTGAEIIVNGVSFDDVLDVTSDNLNLCPRVWFGDAGYNDRPQGEDEENPPANPYPLQQPQMEGAVRLGPGEDFTLPVIELYMIEAAPNQCQNRFVGPRSTVDWEFAPTYHPVTGTITDSVTGSPVDTATVTIAGTTENGITSEELPVDANGFYASNAEYQSGTELTVVANAPGYSTNQGSITVAQGDGNIVNLALDPIPVTGTVAGAVTDITTTQPVANATVSISGLDVNGLEVSETVSTNENGEYRGESNFLTGTAVTVIVNAEGFAQDTAGLDSLSEGVNVVDIALQSASIPAVTVSGTITDIETGLPIAGSSVTLTGIGSGGQAVSETVVANSDGMYASTMSFEVGSSVTVVASADGYQDGTRTMTLDEPGNVNISLQLTPIGEVPTETAPAEPEPSETPVIEPDPVETETQPVTTPTPDDAATTTPPATEEPAPTQPVVSSLPSTGSGGSAPVGLLIAGSLASVALIAGAIRRKNS